MKSSWNFCPILRLYCSIMLVGMVTVTVATSHVSHRFPIQLLVDFDLACDWLNEELVLSVAADDGIEDVAVRLAVDVLCRYLGNHQRNYNVDINIHLTCVLRTVDPITFTTVSPMFASSIIDTL